MLPRICLNLIPLILFAVFSGCQPENQSSDTEKKPVVPEIPKPVSVVLVGNSSAGDEITRLWEAETGGDLSYAEIGLEELVSQDFQALDKTDLLIAPTAMAGELIERDLVSEIPDLVWSSQDLAIRGLLRHNRMTLARFGQKKFGVPIVNPHYMMLIRKEVLESSKLPVPTTWDQLLVLADKAGELEEFKMNVAIPCAQGWAAKSFIAVAAAEIRQRGNLNTLFKRRSLKPLITSPPFVAGLERLKELAGENTLLTPTTVMQEFQKGKAAIAIGWAGSSFFSQSSEDSVIYDNTVASRLPGTRREYDADSQEWKNMAVDSYRVEFTGFASSQIYMLKSASHPMDVYRCLRWLGSKKTTAATLAGTDLGTPTRAAHLGDIQRWVGDVLNSETLDQYSDLLSEAAEYPTYLSFPRIPGSIEYWAALESSVQDFLAGKVDAEAALEKAAEEWEKITEAYGREQQVEMLRKDESL